MNGLLSKEKCDLCGSEFAVLQILDNTVYCNKCFRKKVYGMAERSDVRKKCPFAAHTTCTGAFCGIYSEVFNGCGLALLDKLRIDIETPKAEVSLRVEREPIPAEYSPQNLLGETRNNQSQIVTIAQELSQIKLELEKMRNGNGKESMDTSRKPVSEPGLEKAVHSEHTGAKKGSKRVSGNPRKGKAKKAQTHRA